GRYEAKIVEFRGSGSVVGGEQPVALDLLPGQKLEHRFALALDIPSTCRLVHPDAGDFDGWRYQCNGVDWRSVAADGVLGARMYSGFTWVKVEDGKGRRYRFYVEGGDGHERRVLLKRGDCGYRGVLRNRSGEPIGNVWVEASPLSSSAEEARTLLTVSVLTDEAGRFEFNGLRSARHGFRFEDMSGRGRSWEPRWRNFRFEADDEARPNASGEPLEIYLQRSEDTVEVSGMLVDPEGQSAAGHVSAEALRRDGAGGQLLVYGKGRSMQVGPDGAFLLSLPAGIPCRITAVATGASVISAEELMTLDAGVSPPPLRLVVKP
ncbi:MAG: hypothetical protein AAGG01_03790, partial [Planctomycetota bacterium]